MPKYKVFYAVEFNGAMEVEADTPEAAWKEIRWEMEDQDLTDGANRELKLDGIQDPDTCGFYPIDHLLSN